MYKKILFVVALILATISFSAFAETADISGNYSSASAIFESKKNAVANATNKTNEITKCLDQASTFLVTDRAALYSANGYAVPAQTPEVLLANRVALTELFTDAGYKVTDYLKTLTIRIPANYNMDFGTFSIARSTLQEARQAGFTNVVFQNDLFAVRFSTVNYLPKVPETVTTLKYFVGETRNGVPQGALDIAGSMPLLVFREYHDGVLVTDANYAKNTVAIVVESAMYSIAGKQPTDNLFYVYDAVTETAASVTGYLYTGISGTAAFAAESGNYFFFLPKEKAPTYDIDMNGFGAYNIAKSGTTFTADLFFEEVCAGGDSVVLLVLYDQKGNLSQVSPCYVDLELGEVSLTFDIEETNDTAFDLMIWRSADTIKPLFGKISGNLGQL